METFEHTLEQKPEIRHLITESGKLIEATMDKESGRVSKVINYYPDGKTKKRETIYEPETAHIESVTHYNDKGDIESFEDSKALEEWREKQLAALEAASGTPPFMFSEELSDYIIAQGFAELYESRHGKTSH